ncbi:MAG: hypothetical protein MUE85_09580 [Microscillaceae bacterium]|jgi:hypothetical protein|nr:hypothetical protein [Microscillaceae bacterium]
MNKQLVIWTLIILNLLVGRLLGQEILKKEKIYTLTTNEVIAYEENSLGLYQDELGYIVVTADVKKFTRNYHIKGKIYGPFDRRLVEKPVFNLNSWGFIDSREETSFVLFNGREIGVHKDPLYPVGLKVSSRTWAYVLIDQVEGTTKVIINGKEYGPYTSLFNYYISGDGSRWAVAYNENPEEFYLEFNDGKKVGPYKSILDFEFLEGRGGKRWVMLADKKDLPSKTVNGQTINQFVVVTNNGEAGTFEQTLADKADFNFRNLITKGANYGLNVVKDQKVFYLANDNLYGPYKKPVIEVDMGEEYNKFNYIVSENRELHFTGDGIFSRNVEKYFVSESRKTVAVIKKAGADKDSLYINDKYARGVYGKIAYIKFAPNGETWAMLSNVGGNNYKINFSDNRSYGPYEIDASHGLPTLLLGKDGKNWAFYYIENGTAKNKLIVNNQDRNEEFIGNIAFVKEEGQEYFSWFSLEDKTVYLNKLLLE